MKTLILSPRYTPDSISLRSAALTAGWDVERLVNWRPPVELRNRQNIEPIPYGEPLFAAVVADTFDLALIEPHFSWLAELPHHLRKRDIAFTNLGAARAKTQRAFIKPADDKCFAARVYDSGAQLPGEDVLDASVPVLIAEPVTWESEFRSFVLEGKVATLSVYSRHGETAQTANGIWPATPSEIHAAHEFCATVLANAAIDHSFPPAVVLDVGVIAERGWAVVEANACWGAGIYGCDPLRVLDTLSRACRHRSVLAEADRRWVIERQNAV